MNEHGEVIEKIRKEMYACLASSVDAVIFELEMLSSSPKMCTQENMAVISAKLRDALLRSEEIYVSADGGETER